MPNWCDNSVTLTHEDPAMIERIVAGYNGDGLMQAMIPCPVELLDERASTHGGPNAEEYDAVRAALRSRFGYSSWYDWRVANWGTKWDVSHREGNGDADLLSPNAVRLSFRSAWNPPLGFYAKLEEMGFSVDAFYYEPGMGFCGRYSGGVDECHNITGNSDWVDENIPEEINEMFAIAETMSCWEQEEEGQDEEVVEDPEVYVHTNDGYNGLGFNGTARQALEAVRALRPMIDQQEPGETPNWLSDFVSTLEGLCQEAGVMDKDFNPTGE